MSHSQVQADVIACSGVIGTIYRYTWKSIICSYVQWSIQNSEKNSRPSAEADQHIIPRCTKFRMFAVDIEFSSMNTWDQSLAPSIPLIIISITTSNAQHWRLAVHAIVNDGFSEGSSGWCLPFTSVLAVDLGSGERYASICSRFSAARMQRRRWSVFRVFRTRTGPFLGSHHFVGHGPTDSRRTGPPAVKRKQLSATAEPQSPGLTFVLQSFRTFMWSLPVFSLITAPATSRLSGGCVTLSCNRHRRVFS